FSSYTTGPPDFLTLSLHDALPIFLFWGCFIALITTAYAFISRLILCGGPFITDFGLDKVRAGELGGAGIWPFGVSIILFSLVIEDRKSTRLNSSHLVISYAVFCLK